MANTKQDFYGWVRQTYPGFWPENMDEIDWAKLPYSVYVKQWEATGYPSGIPAGPSGIPEGEGATTLKATRAGLLQPMVGGAGADTLDKYEVLYGGTVWRRKADGVYVDPETEYTLSDEEFKFRRSSYYKSLLTAGGEAAETPQWRPGELEFQKERFEWEKQRTLREEQLAREQGQEQLFRTYEEYRRRLLSELTDPSDWITRWMVEQTPEMLPLPKTTTEGGAPIVTEQPARGRMLYDFEVIEGEALAPNDVVITDTAQKAEQLGATLWIPRKKLDDELITNSIRWQFELRNEGAFAKPPSNKEIFQFARWHAAENQMGPGRGAGVGVWDITQAVNPSWVPQVIGRQGAAAESPTWEQVLGQVKGTPGAPGWLPTFAPGQTTGRPITKERVAPPSGQQWLATPWSQRQGLGGFAEWGGQSFTDVLNQMAMMQTATPRGAGGTRWAPRRQVTAV